jgi:VanZ family protein
MLRRIWLAFGWLWVIAVFYLSLAHNPPTPMLFEGLDKLEHALAYCILMLWFSQLHPGHKARIRLILLFTAMGIGIEYLQGMSGYRYFEYADMLANTIGVLAGWGLAQTRMGQLFVILESHGKY